MSSPRRLLYRTARALAWVLAVLLLLFGLVRRLSAPVQPDAFYSETVPERGKSVIAAEPGPSATAGEVGQSSNADLGKPGTLLRAEPFTRDVPASARGWRILYSTTRGDGRPALASAIVVASRAESKRLRPVIAWAHGTTGVNPGCAPSLLAHPFANLPSMDAVIGKGWAIVATDYLGLGTGDLHPYLIGADEAHSTLDAIRAARALDEVDLSNNVVVWGHSQGGHAALWTGILAPSYAPDVTLDGVAALAPASDLPALVLAVHRTLAGKLTSSYLATAYSATYSDVQFDDVVRAGARTLTRDIARRCIQGNGVLVSVVDALLLGRSLYNENPVDGAYGERLKENIPNQMIAAPLLIAQGLTDDLVVPNVQEAYVKRRRDAGQRLTYNTYPGRDHLSLVATDSPLNADLLRWTSERFEGIPAGSGCERLER